MAAANTTDPIPRLARQLATYAKQLGEGMRERVKREPDIADYLGEFERLIRAAFLPDAKTPPGGNKPLPACQQPDCHNLAAFIINDRAVCHEHRPRDFAPPSLRK